MRAQLRSASFFNAAVVSVLFWSVLCAGCGSDAKPGANKKAEVKVFSEPSKQVFQPTGDSIPAMYLDRATFLDSNNIKYKDKLILRLALQKDSNQYLLSVHPAGKSGKVSGNALVKYPKAFINELSASGGGTDHFFAEHHTKENDFQKLWQEIKKYELVNYLLFEPIIDSNQHFCYRITGVEKLPIDLSAAHGFATKPYYSHPSNHVWK